MKKLIPSFLRPQKIYFPMPKMQTDFTFDEILYFIHNISDPGELNGLTVLVDQQSFDQLLTEDQQFLLHSEIFYTRALLRYIDKNLPHDYYPPFAIENHILNAINNHQVNAMTLHLQLYAANYNKSLRDHYSNMILIAKSTFAQPKLFNHVYSRR